MRGSMAINPQDIADENTQRSALAEKGSPTEFAEDPKQSIQLAGKLNKQSTMALLELFGKAKEVDTPPTPQERVLTPDDGTYSETKTKKKSAKELLSPEGQEQFKQQGFLADEPERVKVLREAEEALSEDQAVEKSFVDVNTKAKQALTADARGADPEQALVDEARADEALRLIETREAGIKPLTEGGDFNFDYMNTGDDINATLTALSQVYKDETKFGTRPGMDNNVTVQKASEKLQDEIGFTRQTIFARKEGQNWSAEEFVAARELLVRSADKLTKLAQKIQDGGANNADGVFEKATDLDRLAFRRQMAIHAGIQLQLKGAQTEAGRALQSFQIKIGGEESAVRQSQEARRLLEESGGIELVDDMASKILNVYDKEGLSGLNGMTRGGSWMAKTRQFLSEAYLAGLLSNTSTQVRNSFGTFAFMAYQLPAELIAGAYGSFVRQGQTFLYPNQKLSNDQVYIDDALVRFKGYMDSYKDALRVAAVAFKTELPANASKLDLEVYRASKPGSDSYLASVFDWWGKAARIPFRVLLFSDEFFKTISQRGELYVEANHAFKNALRNGKSPLQAQDQAAMVLLDPASRAGKLIDQSKFDTLQSDLGKLKKASNLVQNFSIFGVPFGRYIMPFTTAPTNDLIRTAEFVPILNLATPDGAMDLFGKNGAKKHQMAMGRMAVVGMTLGMIGNYALEGRITGAVPRDEGVRNSLPKGWQPWSFVFKGENWPVDKDGNELPMYDMYGRPNGELVYVSYQGFGPLTSVIGIGADTAQRLHLANDPVNILNVGFGGVAATANYFKDAPMLEGMSNLVSVLDNDSVGDFNLGKILKSPAEAGSVATVPGIPFAGIPNPYSSLQRAVDRMISGSVTKDPREDVEYYTYSDIEQQNEDGTYVHATRTGKPDWKKVGTPKNLSGDILYKFIVEMDAYQSKNSAFEFKDEDDKLAPRLDTLGRQLGSEDLNIFTRPGRAIISNLSGVRLSESEKPEPYELELMRLSATTGSWPLNNPRTKENLRLSPGVRMDWIDQSKNKSEVIINGAPLKFKQALKSTLTGNFNSYGRRYQRAKTDVERKTIIKELETKFLDQGWEDLLKDPKYINIVQSLRGIERAKAEGKIK